MENKFAEWIKQIPEEQRAEVIAKVQKCKDKESILALAAEYGLSLPDDLAELIEKRLNQGGIMSEGDLSFVAGGFGGRGVSLTCGNGC